MKTLDILALMADDELYYADLEKKPNGSWEATGCFEKGCVIRCVSTSAKQALKALRHTLYLEAAVRGPLPIEGDMVEWWSRFYAYQDVTLGLEKEAPFGRGPYGWAMREALAYRKGWLALYRKTNVIGLKLQIVCRKKKAPALCITTKCKIFFV